MDDLQYIIEKWMDNRQETNLPSEKPTEPVTPVTEPVLPNAGMSMSGWDVHDYYACDDVYLYQHDDETEPVAQNKCLLEGYMHCDELPRSFMLVWKEGDKLEQLMVPDRCRTTRVVQGKDFRKYAPLDDDEPHPAAYAARGTDPASVYIMTKVEEVAYQTRYHHTTTGSSDGGKSLVLCPGDTTRFDRCESDGVEIPYHGTDNGRLSYWNMTEVPVGDIVCTKDGKTYRYRAEQAVDFGEC
jgi:hypothetical protein